MVLSDAELLRAFDHVARRLAYRTTSSTRAATTGAVAAEPLLDEQAPLAKVFAVPERGDLEPTSRRCAPLASARRMFHVAVAVWAETPGGVERRGATGSPVLVTADGGGLGRAPAGSGWYRALLLAALTAHLLDRAAPPTSSRVREIWRAQAWNEDFRLAKPRDEASGFHEHLRSLGVRLRPEPRGSPQ